MLSFEPARKRSFKIANAKNNTTGEKFELYFNPIYGKGESLVEIEDKMPVLLSQEEVCLERYHVSPEDFKKIAQNVASGGTGVRLLRNKRMCHRFLLKHLRKVAKTELDFTDEDITLSLHLDTDRKRGEPKKSYCCLAVGNTGAGKSYTLTHEFLLRDKNKKNKTYYFFSAVPEDESLDALIKFANRDPTDKRFFRVNLNPDEEDREAEDFEPPKLELKSYGRNDVLIFDDVESLNKNNPYRAGVLELMINGCQRARHNECQIVSTSHHLRNYRLTRNLVGASKWIILFPRANKRAFQHQILEDELAFTRTAAKELTERIARMSRWVFLHQHSPKYLLCEKALILL